MALRRAFLASLVLACAVNCANAPQPSPEGRPAPTPEQCELIIARGGAC